MKRMILYFMALSIAFATLLMPAITFATSYVVSNKTDYPVAVIGFRDGLCSAIRIELGSRHSGYTGNDVWCSWNSIIVQYYRGSHSYSCRVKNIGGSAGSNISVEVRYVSGDSGFNPDGKPTEFHYNIDGREGVVPCKMFGCTCVEEDGESGRCLRTECSSD